MSDADDYLFEPLELPCGVILRNRIAKSAMSDSLGDGTGHPTPEQAALYARWAQGGAALSIIGEVQADAGFPEKPGNLVLDETSDLARFRDLARRGAAGGAQLWPQIGHAGAMAYPPVSRAKGPSALNLPGLTAEEMTRDEIAALPGQIARTAGLAREAGFGGVEIHAAHGFLLNQFLSPLFNRRSDGYGGDIRNRMRLLLEVTRAVRLAVGPDMAVGVKLNATDQLEGGLTEEDALAVVSALDATEIDLIDISGGTYFPGAKSASDSGGAGPYFVDFAHRARAVTRKPLMVTGGFKTQAQAIEAVSGGAVDMVGMARALVIAPDLPKLWMAGQGFEPEFPRFSRPPVGGVTAWYTMALTAIAERRALPDPAGLQDAIEQYEARDAARVHTWRAAFGRP